MRFCTLPVLSTALCLAPAAVAQDVASPARAVPGSAVSGTVTDSSGAIIPGATVHVDGGPTGANATADALGRFTLPLAPGTYRLFITAPGFQPYVRDKLAVSARANKPLAIALQVATENEVVDVSGDAGGGGEAGSGLVFKKEQLDTLSSDDATLQQQLLALAGGDGQHAPQVYVDGFSGGRFPPKSAIREVRINQNPFSAQYDGLGFGRIEIFTKPGADKLHGFLQVQGNDSGFNAPNPFARNQPPYHALFVDGNVSGPLDKKTSYFLSTNYNDQAGNAVINAVVPTADGSQTSAISQAVPDPQVFHNGSARLDRQLTTNNTFTARYEFNRADVTNGGIGQLTLASEAVDTSTTTQTLQVGNTQVIGAHKTNETRFQYIRTRLDQSAVDGSPALIVQGSFNGGGSPAQRLEDRLDQFEFQDYFGWDHKAHFIRIGGRYRLNRDSNIATANYNGQFIFPDLNTYQITLRGLAAGLTPAQIRAQGGGATQFTITQGQTGAAILTGDLGVYAEDEWKVRKNVTLNFGLRFESQSAVYDHSDPAPRIGYNWAVHQGDKKGPWFVLGGGFGLFYDRFPATNLLTTVRQNGVSQLQYVIDNPDTYPTPPSLASRPNLQPTIYRLAPNERSPYDMVASVRVERSLGKYGSINANYLNFRSVHQFVSINANAPLPGTYNPAVPGSGTRPLGNANVYQFTSGALSRGNVFFTNYNLQAGKRASIWGFVVLQQFNSSGIGSPTNFASNSYDINADYAPAFFNRKARVFTGATLNLPFRFVLEPFLAYNSAMPFNITTGADNNGDSIYNDRPAFATDLTRSSVRRTAFGNFDLNPQPGQQIIPANYGTGPQYVSLQLALNKSFRFGPLPPVEAGAPAPPPGKPAPKPDPRYELGFSAEAQNLFNHTNGSTPIGVLTSPYFGQSISLNSFFSNSVSANRVINVRTFFRF